MSSWPARDHDEEQRDRTRPLERVRDPAHQQRGHDAGAGPGDRGQAGRPEPAAVGRAAPSPGVNDAIPIIPAPRTSEPPVAARNRGCRSSSGSSSGAATRRSTRTNAASATSASTPSTTVGSVDAVAALGQGGDRQRHRGDQQHQSGDVDAGAGPPPTTRPSSAGSAATSSSASAAVTQYDRPPAGADVEERRQHGARDDAEPDRRAPHRRGAQPLRTERVAVRERGQAAGQHRGTAAALDDPAGDEQHRLDGHRAETAPDGGRGQPGDVHAAAAERVADDAGREQQPGQADAHRAEDPGPRHRPGAEVGRGGRDGRDRASRT